MNVAPLGVLAVALGFVLGSGCTTRDTGYIDLSIASAVPPHAPPPPSCVSDQDCPKPSPRCSPALRCVQCLVKSDCKDPKKPVCSMPAGTCIECVSDLDCTTDPARTLCELETGHCVGCIGDAGCKPGEQCAPDGVCKP